MTLHAALNQELSREFQQRYEDTLKPGMLLEYDGKVYRFAGGGRWEFVCPLDWSPGNAPAVKYQLDEDIVVGGSQEQVMFSLFAARYGMGERQAKELTAHLFELFRVCGWRVAEEHQDMEPDPVPGYVEIVPVEGMGSAEIFPSEDLRRLLRDLARDDWDGYARFRSRGNLHVVNCTTGKRIQLILNPEAAYPVSQEQVYGERRETGGLGPGAGEALEGGSGVGGDRVDRGEVGEAPGPDHGGDQERFSGDGSDSGA